MKLATHDVCANTLENCATYFQNFDFTIFLANILILHLYLVSGLPAAELSRLTDLTS